MNKSKTVARLSLIASLTGRTFSEERLYQLHPELIKTEDDKERIRLAQERQKLKHQKRMEQRARDLDRKNLDKGFINRSIYIPN